MDTYGDAGPVTRALMQRYAEQRAQYHAKCNEQFDIGETEGWDMTGIAMDTDIRNREAELEDTRHRLHEHVVRRVTAPPQFSVH